MIDPRRDIVTARLEGVKRILAFCSAKGGVGKTFLASVSALLMAKRGMRAGLFDLDFQGASAHVLLGMTPRLPQEKEGILPLPAPGGALFMSAAAFTGELALPLRGPDVTNAILELLAVTRWGDLDFLILDTPPGIGDEALDLIGLVPRLEAMVVSTPSPVSVAVVGRLLGMFSEMRVPIAGVVANMTRGDARIVAELAARHGAPFAGEVPFDPGVEERMGKPEKLLETPAAGRLAELLLAAGLLPRL